jgi:hypothetical protein
VRHSIHSLTAATVVDDRIRFAAAQRAAREAARQSRPTRTKLGFHLRRARHAIPSV